LAPHSRWQPPDSELILPLAFIPTAEADPHTIRAFTLHTFELAATYASENLGESRIRVAVNLSPAVLRGGRIPAELGRVLRSTGLAPELLDVEITEEAFAEDPEKVAAAIEGIKGLGVGMVMLDDFGVGHSSLARLGALKVDALKIDRELVTGWQRPEYEAVIRSIIELAHGLNLTVIAEGVEDARTQDELRELGCDATQGFYMSPPLPGEDLDHGSAPRPRPDARRSGLKNPSREVDRKQHQDDDDEHSDDRHESLLASPCPVGSAVPLRPPCRNRPAQ
jgi:EAL domain-containing protein (putative c-di-GMP-specific phosphodiesterase class I)